MAEVQVVKEELADGSEAQHLVVAAAALRQQLQDAEAQANLGMQKRLCASVAAIACLIAQRMGPSWLCRCR